MHDSSIIHDYLLPRDAPTQRFFAARPPFKGTPRYPPLGITLEDCAFVEAIADCWLGHVILFEPRSKDIDDCIVDGGALLCQSIILGPRCGEKVLSRCPSCGIQCELDANVPTQLGPGTRAITRRNDCVHAFLKSDCTHMLFVDADICADYLDLMRLVFLTTPDKIVGAPCSSQPWLAACGNKWSLCNFA
jgi:hypothetical protein